MSTVKHNGNGRSTATHGRDAVAETARRGNGHGRPINAPFTNVPQTQDRTDEQLLLAYRQGDGDYVGTASVHGAIFISVAFLVIAVRDTLPLNGFSDRLGFGSETAFTFALKVPIILGGRDQSGWGLFGNGY